MKKSADEQNLGALVIQYLTLRRAVGVVGMALPIVLAVGCWAFDAPGILSSISAYYYSPMRDVMVGSLCAVGIFLLSYKGYDRFDNWLGNLACLFAVGTALFPMAPKTEPTSTQIVIGYLHSAFGGGFLLSLAIFALVPFRKTGDRPTARKLVRNRVYSICGWGIIVCLFGIAGEFMLPESSPLTRWKPVFWFEATAIWAFGWAWFTKGGGIWRDEA